MRGAALLLVALTTLGWTATAAAQEADLAVAATGVYNVDGSVRVTLTVSNLGPDDVMDVDITAQFDTALATASDLPTGCSGSSIGVVCSFVEIDEPVLSSGEELAVELVISPEPGAGEVTFVVRSSTADPNAANDEAVLGLIAGRTVDVGLTGRGIDAGARKTLVFVAANAGPDSAENVRVMGTITLDYDEPKDHDAVEAVTGMSSDGAVCGRSVPNTDDAFDRWTLPVSCSLGDLDAGDEVEFMFWFEESDNAQFRLTATSANLDEAHGNDVIDGDFRNTPLEVIEPPAEDGCCATIRGASRSSGALALLLVVLAIGRRRAAGACVASAR